MPPRGEERAVSSAPHARADAEAAAAARFESVRRDPARLRDFLAAMPVGGDLHHHLGGAIAPDVLVRLASRNGLCIPRAPERRWSLVAGPCRGELRPVADALEDPELLLEVERRWSMRPYAVHDPRLDRNEARDHFFGIFELIDPALEDLAALLAWVRNDAAQQGIVYVETSTGGGGGARLGPLLRDTTWTDDLAALRSAMLEEPQFLRARDETVAALDAAVRGSDRLLGCGLEHALPGCSVVVRLQLIALRVLPKVDVFLRTLLAYEVAAASPWVVGVNLVAPEHDPVSLRDYPLHMRIHSVLGPLYPTVGRSLHAAEFAPSEARRLGATRHLEQAVAAPEAGGAFVHRVGHGVSLAAEERRDEVLGWMRDRGVTVEINLRSNAQLLGVLEPEHPLPAYLEAGVPVVLSTDDPGLMVTTLREQFEVAARFDEVSYGTLKRFALDSIRRSFLEERERLRLEAELRRRFAAFEAGLLPAVRASGDLFGAQR